MARITVRKAAKILLGGGIAALLAATATLYTLDYLYPFPAWRVQDRMTPSPTLVNASDASTIAWRVDGEDNYRLAVGLDDASPWLVKATVAVEDKRFWSHHGVDPIAVARAVWQNVTSGRRVSGASTLTMQTIRLLWPRPRILSSKAVEAFRAWQLERLADKEQILEIYFNLAPYGGNVVGVEAAAQRYFGKSARHLDLAEAALLAGLPQSPARLNPLRHPERALRRRNFVILRMLEDGHINGQQARRAWRTELHIVPPEAPLAARHFADFALSARSSSRSALDTTIDPDIQATVADLASRHAKTLAARGLSGPAVVVLSVADSSILAYVGNAAPEHAEGRLVDAARARRQPGSLLKPFIFALLAEKGGVAPSSRVYDLPHTWGDYAPRNMDREWRGEMTAAEALRQSRNITSVKQLAQLGTEQFSDFMKEIGLEPGGAGKYGLTLALGGKEQNLLAVTNAYAALGRLGLWQPVRHLPDDDAAASRRVLSPEAAWLALSALAAPEEERAPGLVWKTGTSWNQLDGWAVAMSPEVVVGVWCGRLARGGGGWTSGGDDALPLALSALQSIADTGATWAPPEGIEFREVCTVSGTLPGWHCPETIVSPLLATSASGHPCPSHSPAPVAARTKRPVSGQTPRQLKIASPTTQSTYVASRNAVLPLSAEGGDGDLTWFRNGELLGSVAAGSVLEWEMTPGSHRFSVSDSAGNSAAVEVSVLGSI